MSDGKSTVADNGQVRVPSIEAGVLNAVAHGCWQTSDSHGFHDDWKAADFLEALAVKMQGYQMWEITGDVDSKDTSPVDTYLVEVAEILRTNILGMKLMLTVSELGEALESLRNVGASGLLSTEPHDRDDIRAKSRANFGEELADAKIRLDDLAGYLRIAIGDEQIAKMAINETRPHKHGRVV